MEYRKVRAVSSARVTPIPPATPGGIAHYRVTCAGHTYLSITTVSKHDAIHQRDVHNLSMHMKAAKR